MKDFKILALASLLCLSACGGDKSGDQSSSVSSTQSSTSSSSQNSSSSFLSSSVQSSSSQSNSSVADMQSAIQGFAGVAAMGLSTTTGGAAGPIVTVSTKEELTSYMDVNDPYVILIDGVIDLGGMEPLRSDKTLIGLNGAKLINGGLELYNRQNIIIRNISFEDASDDALKINQQSHHIWIDHCNFTNGADGLIDITRQSGYVTISWNHFYNHSKTILIGHSDGYQQDLGYLKTTLHHNWFDGSVQRHPRVRFGEVHIFNNYYFNINANNDFGVSNGYGVASAEEADVLLEANYFYDVSSPALVGYADSAEGDILARGNILDQSGEIQTRGAAFEANSYYSYSLDGGDAVPAIVMAGAGVGKIDPYQAAQMFKQGQASSTSSSQVSEPVQSSTPASSLSNSSSSTAQSSSSLISSSSSQSNSSQSSVISDASVFGFASVNRLGISGTNGGHGGEIVNVSNFAQLAAAVEDNQSRIIRFTGTIQGDGNTKMLRVGSNKTIEGVGTDARIEGFGLNVSGWNPTALGIKSSAHCDQEYEGQFEYTYNVIIRNIYFNNSPDDGINVQCWSHHVLIDHNTFENVGDGAVDIKRGSDWVTVSWNKFIAINKTMLLGHDEQNWPQDIGHLHVTYHHNWFHKTRQRHPRTRYCVAHLFNNWMDNPDNANYFIGVGVNSNIYADYNYVDSGNAEVTQSMGDTVPSGVGESHLTWADSNYILSGDGVEFVTGDAFNPADFYAYSPDPAVDVPAMLMQYAGAGKL